MDATLLAYLLDWLHLLTRWLHVVAAIAWVGASFYFIALDYSLQAPADERAAGEGVGGEAWEIHGGGFYRIEKFRVAPAQLPRSLRWFQWEAYTTWLTGFALLVLLYYADPGTYLIDPAVAALAPGQAVGASLGILAVTWLVYDALSRRLADRELLLTAAIAVLVVAITWAAGHLFSARAAYIEVGSALGTWMAANVFFVIIPGQRELVAAKRAGREPDPSYGTRGKQRSVHNNYLTLPVVFAMISQHFPFTYGHAYGWLVLLALMAAGAGVRHFFNLRHQGRATWRIPLATLVLVLLLGAAIAPWPRDGGGAVAGADFAMVQAIVGQRCLACHSVQPTYPGIIAPPKGVAFDTPEQVGSRSRLIYQQVVVSRAMPPGNVTGMTQEERDVIARWFEAGTPR